MEVTTEKFIRKPLYVDAVRVKADNFDEMVAWCDGEVQTEEVQGTGTIKKFIKVRVHNPKNPRQTKAFIGDWLLYTDRGYKVYTNKAFRAAFDLVPEEPKTVTAEEIREKLPIQEPRSAEKVRNNADPIEEAPAPIHAVRPGDDLGTTPQGEQIEVVGATPEAIADEVMTQDQIRRDSSSALEEQPVEPDPVEETPVAPPPTPAIVPPEVAPQPQPVPEQAPQEAAAGKYVLSKKEQADLGPEEVRELIASGEAVLEQDLAESA